MNATEWMEKHSLEMGDQVKIVEKDAGWVSAMDECLGCVGELIGVYFNRSLLVDVGYRLGGAWLFSPDALEPIKKEKK